MVLDTIKQHVEEKELSFLIGAGFSKNISLKYPSWDELLSDAIWEMFGKGNRKRNEAEVKADAIRELGYLGIASKMVARSGFHETIDTYIEEHTPYLINKGGKPVLRINGKELKDNLSFRCHELLKSLEIQNIYTFNYDNALEFCLGDEKRKQLEKEITDLDNKCKELVEKRDEIIKRLQESLEERKKESKEDDVLSGIGVSVPNGQELKGMVATKEEQTKVEQEKTKLNSQIEETKARISVILYELANYYQVVKDSSNISLTANRKNIYKIHGDLRESPKARYGFDGDKHAQYIITKEDYDTYNDKHSAFVSLMRIDLLRNRFCIMGVSGGDANFLAWINWVKDVLDKDKDKEEKSWSYFIYSRDDEMDAAMVQMLENHFICPVILKDIFPEAKSESERITRFLEYIQPFGHQKNQVVELWKGVDIWGVRRLKAIPLDDKSISDLLEATDKNWFHKHNSDVHYKAVEVQFAVKDFLQKPVNPKRLRLYASALRCSMIPINLSCGLKGSPALEQTRYSEVKQTYTVAMRRARLLANVVRFPQKEFQNDPYSAVLHELFNFTFPSEEKLALLPKTTGLDYVRHFSLCRLLDDDKVLTDEIKYDAFNSPQELVLAVDSLKSINKNVKDSIMSHKADEYRHHQSLFTLQEFFRSYLLAMREWNEVQPYGSNVEMISMDGKDSGVINAAVILNSFVELGITVQGRWFVDDNEWIKIVGLLKEYYPYPLVFYTIARGGKEAFFKKVAQELMYSQRCQTILPDILVKMLLALKSKETPSSIMTAMAIFARNLFPAIPKPKWKRCFMESVDAYLDYADNSNDYNLQKSLYLLVGEGLEYVNSKTLNLRLIERVLDTPSINGDFDNHFNSLVVDALRGLKADDFLPLADKFMAFARKADNRIKRFITMNLVSLLDKGQRHKLMKDIGIKMAQDPYLIVSCAYYMKDCPDTASSLKAEFMKGDDYWMSGIRKDGSVSVGGGNVEVSRLADFLSFDDKQLLMLYKDMVTTLTKVSQMFKNPKHELVDRGWMSEENVFRDMVTDMVLFVHKNEKKLSKETSYAQILATLSIVYHQCFFNKTIMQMISDGKIHRSIRRLMIETEVFGIKEYKMEYALLFGVLLSREAKEINDCFRHLSWVLTKHKSLFNTPEFITLISSVLDSYAQYYVDGNAREWDIESCEKEVAEKHLVHISKTLKRWRHPHPFWNKYKKRYYLR